MMNNVVRMCDLSFNPKLFETFRCGTALDELLSSHQGLPRGVNYMIIGDPGVGKTTIILDMLANVQKRYPQARILFISAEMNEIDLTIYVERYPKFQTLPILFVESDFDNLTRNWEKIKTIIEEGWDIVAIDSFYELQGIIKDEENIRMKDAESWLLQLMKKQNKGQNERQLNCTFLTIQQVTKSGNFVGSNRLKHSITAMMELRLENPKNIYSDRFITFSKHRRGDVGVKLFYSLSSTGNVSFDEQRFRQEQHIKHIQSRVAGEIRNFADEFDKLFTPE
ncbi:MAG: AAA family ATPase [Porphyromonas sp.]|nr:AAA family ATPase [Porphyromonas sp.]